MVIVSDRFIKFLSFFCGMDSRSINAMAFFPFIILASKTKRTDVLINHERIHLRQQLELLILPFYIWYLVEIYVKGYWECSFEKEAYANETNLNYLKTRKWFSFLKY